MEDYKKKYEEALERARSIHNEHRAQCADVMVEVFPELTESEDEKIRKALIYHYKGDGCICTNEYRIDYKDIRAWLEKQDTYYTFEIKSGHWYKCVCDYMLNGSDLMFKNGRLYYCRSDWRLESEIDERNVKDIGVHGYKSFFRPATNREIKDWLEKQGEPVEINPTEFDTRLQALIGKFDSLPKEELIGSLSFWINVVQNDGTYKSDEKQGESHEERIDEINRKVFPNHYDGYAPVLETEQKPADKVEPKFKVGDWVVYDHRTYQIVELPQGKLINASLSRNGKTEQAPLPYCEKWTINDAKDGDVLCYKDEVSLYKHDIKNCTKEETTFGSFVYYCCYDGKRFITDSLYSLTKQDKIDIHPATEEQRDLLFQKMHEAGYEWDAKKKELKKIEHNHAWSEEDEAKLKSILFHIEDVENKDVIDWLKSLKDRVQPQPKQEWSIYDETILKSLIDHFEYKKEFNEAEDYDIVLWLKSLRPQKQWELIDDNLPEFKDKLCELFQRFRWHKDEPPTNGDILEYIDAHIQELLAIVNKQKPITPKFKINDVIKYNQKQWTIIGIDINNHCYDLDNDECVDFDTADYNFELVEQKHTEWSEEDERIIKQLTSLWSEVMIEPTCCRFGLHKDEVIHWLESLKPHNTWKPSEEQMDALLFAEGYIRGNNAEEISIKLASLYEQLKGDNI